MRRTWSSVRSAGYGNRMTTPREELKSGVATLRTRMDVADSRTMETQQLLKDLKSGMGDLQVTTTGVKTDVRDLRSQMEHAYKGLFAVPEDTSRIEANVPHIKTDL